MLYCWMSLSGFLCLSGMLRLLATLCPFNTYVLYCQQESRIMFRRAVLFCYHLALPGPSWTWLYRTHGLLIPFVFCMLLKESHHVFGILWSSWAITGGPKKRPLRCSIHTMSEYVFQSGDIWNCPAWWTANGMWQVMISTKEYKGSAHHSLASRLYKVRS